MKEKFFRVAQALLAVAAFVILFAVKGMPAQARYTTYIYNAVQVAETVNSITIMWNAPEDASALTYNLGFGPDSKTASTMAEYSPIVLTPDTQSYTFTGLSAGSEYYFCVEYSYRSKYGNKTYTSSLARGDMRTAPAPITGLNQERWWRWAKKVDVAWDQQKAVDGYEYIFSDSDGNVIDQGTVDYAYYSHSIKNTVIYKTRVRAYSIFDGRVVYSDWSPECYLMIQPSRAEDDAEVNAKISGGKMKVSWKKLKGASGYNVFVSTKLNSGYKKVKSVKANKSSVVTKFGKKSFKRNKTYYIYVQAYKNVGGNKVTTGVNYVTVLKRNRVSYTYIGI